MTAEEVKQTALAQLPPTGQAMYALIQAHLDFLQSEQGGLTEKQVNKRVYAEEFRRLTIKSHRGAGHTALCEQAHHLFPDQAVLTVNWRMPDVVLSPMLYRRTNLVVLVDQYAKDEQRMKQLLSIIYSHFEGRLIVLLG